MTAEDITGSVVYSELFWLKEITYQLAVANERIDKDKADELSSRKVKRDILTDMFFNRKTDVQEDKLYVPKVTEAEWGIYD